MNFIDIHCHILPSIDDGPSDIDESLRMFGIARQDGISRIFATPHIADGLFPNDLTKIISSVEDMRRRLPEGIELFYGADVRITPDLIARARSGQIPTLQGSGYMLIEFPEFIIPANIEGLLSDLRLQGITPVVTHPERHLRLMHDFTVLSRLRDGGAIFQITAMSITGGFGPEIRGASLSMIKEGLADIIASDAHNADTRPPILSRAYREVQRFFGDEMAGKLFFENPAKILKECV